MDETKIIEIVDSGEARYCLDANFEVLGRMWDNGAEEVVVVKPERERDHACIMIVTVDGETIEHIVVGDEPVKITNLLSRHSSVNIGFTFVGVDGYTKNSAVKKFYFLKAQKPGDFVPVEPENKENLELLVEKGFVDAQLNNNELLFYGIKGNVVASVHLSGFVQEQSDLGELDSTKETFVKGKKTSNLENDGDGKSPFATEEFVLNNHSGDASDERGNIFIIGGDGVVESERVVYTIQDADSFVPYRTNQRQFIIDLNLPVVGTVDSTSPVNITFGDTTYNVYNLLSGGNKPITFGDLASVTSYSTSTGYRTITNVIFMETSDIVGFSIIPSAINAEQLAKIIDDTDGIVVSLNTTGDKLSLQLNAEITNRLQRTLVTPMSSPSATELVAVDDGNSQTMIEIGSGLKLENGVLSSTGGGEGGGSSVNVVDNLTSQSGTDSLSAKQGNVLYNMIIDSGEAINQANLNAQKQVLLGADGVLNGTTYSFTVQNPDDYISYRTNLTKFLVDLNLPIVGELDTTKEVAITFGDTSYYVFNILKGMEHATIADLHQVDKYNNESGYRFITEMTFFENSDITGFAVIPTISMSDILALDSDQMDNYLAEGGLTQGQLAVCKKLINNGYEEGSLYRFDITYPNTYSWTKLSLGLSESQSQINNKLDKMQYYSSGFPLVYYVGEYGQGGLSVTDTPIGETVPFRDSNGNLSATDPIKDEHLATKKYVDDALLSAGGGFSTETFVGATGLYNRVSELFDGQKNIRVTVIPSSTTTGGGTNAYNPYEISGQKITIPLDGVTFPSSSSSTKAVMFANRSYCGYVSEKGSSGNFVISINSNLSLVLSNSEIDGKNSVDITYYSLQYSNSGLIVREFKTGTGLLYSATFILEYV